MKTIYAIFTLIVFAAATTGVAAQNYPEEYLGLPGDNLNLYAVMNLFQESETLEKFEQALNNEEQMINNLDLNSDNLIDYITVSDHIDGNVHNIVLRAALSQNEQQDVAVFVVEKLRNGAVEIQLIGDEALYGPNYIVEPIYAETPNPGYTGSVYNRNVNVVTTTYHDIAAWPMVRFIYRPGYMAWRSSWYWGYYPRYWRPWRAHYWHYYYGYHYHWRDHYYAHYRPWHRYRCRSYHTHYHSHVRVYSPTVAVNIHKDRYRNTYSRPGQRRAGEQYYTQTASRRGIATRAGVSNSRTNSRTGKVANRQSVQRTATPSNRTRSNVSTTGQRNSRSSTVQRTQPNNRSSVQRSNSTSRKSTPSVQRASNSRSNSRSSTVQRSQPSNRSSVQRSNSTSRKSAPSVQRTSNSRSRSSTVKRSQPSNSRSSDQRSSSRRNSGGSRSNGASRR